MGDVVLVEVCPWCRRLVRGDEIQITSVNEIDMFDTGLCETCRKVTDTIIERFSAAVGIKTLEETPPTLPRDSQEPS